MNPGRWRSEVQILSARPKERKRRASLQLRRPLARKTRAYLASQYLWRQATDAGRRIHGGHYVRVSSGRFAESVTRPLLRGEKRRIQPNTCSTTTLLSELSAEDGETRYSTAQKGELALLRVLQRSLQKGWIASRPTRDCRYDLVLDDGQRLLRIQVKYAARRATHCQGAVSLDFTKGGRRDRTYLDHEIDAVVVYVAPADAVVWLAREHFHGRRNIQLRYHPTRSGQRSGCFMVDELIW